jgi:alkylation response protein AidB-like acyl-CoA dehydrogenase
MTVEHLCTRKQFGRPLALFQALKHRCADLKTQLAAVQALLEDTLLGLQQYRDGPEAARAAALAAQKAKYLACNVYAKVTEEALQLHGGIGMAVEYPCHLFLKRSMLNEHLGAGEDDYTAAIADALLADLQ